MTTHERGVDDSKEATSEASKEMQTGNKKGPSENQAPKGTEHVKDLEGSWLHEDGSSQDRDASDASSEDPGYGKLARVLALKMFKDSIKRREVELKQWQKDAQRFHENLYGKEPSQTKKDMCKTAEKEVEAANQEGLSMTNPEARGTEARAAVAQTNAQTMS